MLPESRDIRAEYDQAASLTEEWQKTKWASEKSMRSRFELAMSLLPFARSEKWLDIGCGPGSFQAMALTRFPNIVACGIDISPRQIAYAKSRDDRKKCHFEVCDFLDCNHEGFDLLSCIGVLQRSNFSCDFFFEKARMILNPGGTLFLDTKTREWEKFVSGELQPDPHLQWFSLRELKRSAEKNGFAIQAASGFDPHLGEIVGEAASSTIFLAANRQ